MTIFDVLTLAGGLGLFVYGIVVLGESLEKLAGSRMQHMLEVLTANRLKGVLVGAAITGVIQSSSATTVMVVGFVNAGIMKLTQAVGVIMGANIGTTITAQILRLGDISNEAMFLKFLKPSTIAPITLIVGAALVLLSKRVRRRDIGLLLLGFGMLFFGMTTMEIAVAPLKDIPEFSELFLKFSNPLLGVAVGAIVTAVMQSSSASVGMLQALATTGMIPFASAIPIILGQNIGTCITAMLSSIGASTNGKRAAGIHLYFNLIGTILCLIIVYTFQHFVGFSFWDHAMTRGNIANFHSIFNICNTIVLFPFANGLVKLATLTIARKRGDEIADTILDERFLGTPTVALDQTQSLIAQMGKTAKENLNSTHQLLLKYDEELLHEIEKKETFLDEAEANLQNYLLRLSSVSINERESRRSSKMLHCISDFERIGDYIINIAEAAQEKRQNNIVFSEQAEKELAVIWGAVSEIMDMTIESFEKNDSRIANQIEPLEEVIDVLKESLKTHHVDRLQCGVCTIKTGLIFIEILTNLERISDHCSNVAIYILQYNSGSVTFDPHDYLKKMHEGITEEYKALYSYYEQKYEIDIGASDSCPV